MKLFPENCICKIVAQDQGKTKGLRALKGDPSERARCTILHIKI